MHPNSPQISYYVCRTQESNVDQHTYLTHTVSPYVH